MIAKKIVYKYRGQIFELTDTFSDENSKFY